MQQQMSIGERLFRKIACNSRVSSRRIKSIRILASNPSEKNIESLLHTLSDVDPEVRKAAATYLLMTGKEEVIDKILCKMDPSNPIVWGTMIPILVEIFSTPGKSEWEATYLLLDTKRSHILDILSSILDENKHNGKMSVYEEQIFAAHISYLQELLA